MKWSNRRTQFWVDPEFQGRFLRTFLFQQIALILVTIALTAGVTYFALGRDPGAGRELGLAALAYVGLFVGVSAIAVWMGLNLSHRICGPIYRIMQWLKGVRRGDEPGAISLRQGDEFLELAESISETVDAINNRYEELLAIDRALAPHSEPESAESEASLPDLVGVVLASDLEQEETATP